MPALNVVYNGILEFISEDHREMLLKEAFQTAFQKSLQMTFKVTFHAAFQNALQILFQKSHNKWHMNDVLKNI